MKFAEEKAKGEMGQNETDKLTTTGTSTVKVMKWWIEQVGREKKSKKAVEHW